MQHKFYSVFFVLLLSMSNSYSANDHSAHALVRAIKIDQSAADALATTLEFGAAVNGDKKSSNSFTCIRKTLHAKVAEVYSKHIEIKLSSAEISDALAFYNTAIGIKVADNDLANTKSLLQGLKPASPFYTELEQAKIETFKSSNAGKKIGELEASQMLAMDLAQARGLAIQECKSTR